MRKTGKSLQEQAAEVLQKAKERGVENNFFFATTFQRYKTQLHIMEELEKEISENGPMVTKEYVKGRENTYTNPAITEYNRTSTAANGTVQTLISIVKSFATEDGAESKMQALMDKLNG